MPTPKKTAEVQFIFTDSNGKAEPTQRKLIRKHAMLGKNRGKTRSFKPIQMETPFNSQGSNGEQDEDPGLTIKMRYSMIPKQAGSELSFTQFAAAVEPPVIHDLLKFSFIAKRVMYPLERYIMFHRKNKVDTVWFELLTCDAVYLHAAVFACQAYIFHMSGQESPAAARRAMVHYSAALRLLRERLSVPEGEHKFSVSDSTVLVVLYLTLHAHFMIDYKTAKHHMNGLRRIVDMRGGLMAFSYNTKLIIELLKCDLGIALNNGTEPLFFNDPSSEPLMPYDLTTLVAEERETEAATKPVHLTSNDLAEAWGFLKRFCSTINSATVHNRQLPKETLLNAMASVMYRLVRMNTFDSTSLDEAVRLGLLVFSSHIFLNWQDVRPKHTYLPDTYRSCLLNLKQPSRLPPQTLVWLLMVGSLSVFAPADDAWLVPWLRGNIDLCEAQDWNGMHEQLKQFPWIDTLHDKPGRAIFDAAVLSQRKTDGGTAPSAHQDCS